VARNYHDPAFIEKQRVNATRHGHYAGNKPSATYRSWRLMLGRCYNPSNNKYKLYGKRGVRVCARWRTSFESFLADMGERPQGTTLDRKDSTGHYTPSNCKWSTPTEQNRNRRGVISQTKVDEIRRRVADGEKQAVLARELKLSSAQVSRIVNRKRWA